MADLYHGPFDTMVDALVRCTFLPGSWDKRFVHDMSRLGESKMTGKQADSIIRLVHKYRRQLSADIIILAQDSGEARAFFQPLERLSE